jgi:hypothetical protein
VVSTPAADVNMTSTADFAVYGKGTENAVVAPLPLYCALLDVVDTVIEPPASLR